MKASENKTRRIEVRVTEDEYNLIRVFAYTIGSTPSKMIRMFIDTTINGIKLKIKRGELNVEDIKSVLDDKL